MGRDGHRRRSHRIKANDDATKNSSVKRKSDNAEPAAAGGSKLAKQVWKGRDGSCGEVVWKSSREEIKKQDVHEMGTVKASSKMPEKHILELVLDTLQRRDTYEIFAEPVNPDEVEDYYKIIKEPMDFGTMRAKLHEGMYENLEQFEHDVFLIPENAMHFNSSATTYFRQARAIHELAKKVFHALKMDPENFVLEFSGTRRRSMRKALSEPKDSRLLPMRIKSTNVGGDAFPKGTSSFIRTSKKTSTLMTTHSGNANGASSSQVEDRRFTYRAWRPLSLFNNEDTTVNLTSFDPCSQLLVMNKVDSINYRNSLMSFVKDLGPTAQMVARQKLLREHELIPGVQILKAGNVIDLTEDGEDHTEKQKTGTRKASTSIAKNNRINKIGRGLRDAAKSDDNARLVILALENSHSKGGVAESKLRNKKNSPMLPWRFGDSQKEEAKKPLAASRFAFDLPFLKARLDQMNALEIGRDQRLKTS